MMYVGIVIFWVLNALVIGATFFMKKGDAKDWYANVLFYGAHELATLVANRSDELSRADGASQPTPCWKPVFIFWWAFSIKFFIPWALLSLMMWNFKADVNLVDGRGYGDYHDLWQGVGFIYPLIGLLCFLIPICLVTTPEKDLIGADGKRMEVDLDVEEDKQHQEEEAAYVAGLKAQKEAMQRSGIHKTAE